MAYEFVYTDLLLVCVFTSLLLFIANGVSLLFILEKGWHATCLAALSSFLVGLVAPVIILASDLIQNILGFWIALLLPSLFVMFVVHHSWQDRLKLHTDWQCHQCGYTLLNLPSNTCPECGKTFDPKVIAVSKDAHEQMLKIKLLGW